MNSISRFQHCAPFILIVRLSLDIQTYIYMQNDEKPTILLQYKFDLYYQK